MLDVTLFFKASKTAKCSSDATTTAVSLLSKIIFGFSSAKDNRLALAQSDSAVCVFARCILRARKNANRAGETKEPKKLQNSSEATVKKNEF